MRSRASFVSHRLDKSLDISDRVDVKKDGEVVAERRAADVLGPELHDMMTGRALDAEYDTEDRRFPSTLHVVLDPEVLGIEGAFGGFDSQLHAGEIVGIGGVLGLGRKTWNARSAGSSPAWRDAGASSDARSA